MSTDRISAIILAGGRGQRMDDADKGLMPLGGKPLVAWVLAQIAPQVDEVLISANRNLDEYRRFGYPVLADHAPAEFSGPLAGILRALETARNPLVLSVPCDTPFLPTNLVSRLQTALMEQGADIAIPVTTDQPQRAACLCRRELAGHLKRFLEQGGRRVGEWQSQLKLALVPFADSQAFANINTPEQLSAAEQQLCGNKT